MPKVGGMVQPHRAGWGVTSWKFPDQQFSEHFPRNILTLEFKIFTVAMWCAGKEEPALVAGTHMCQQRCQWGPRTCCKVAVANGSEASLCHLIMVQGPFPCSYSFWWASFLSQGSSVSGSTAVPDQRHWHLQHRRLATLDTMQSSAWVVLGNMCWKGSPETLWKECPHPFAKTVAVAVLARH